MLFFKKFHYENWKNNYPTGIIEYLYSPCRANLRILNFIFQKLFRINGKVKFMVHFTSVVTGNVKLGKGVARNFANCGHCYFQGINGIEIGDLSIFAPGVKIISSNHDRNDFDHHEVSKSIIIGSKCWIGTNVIILPNVVLGDNVIVGAGSVVTKSFPSNVTIAGNPAKIIKEANVS